MDIEIVIQMVQACQGLLQPSLLTSKDEWRNFNIPFYLEEELEEDLDHVMCLCLEKGGRHCDLDDIG